jgi:predicted permease
MQSFFQDLRYGLRILTKQPGFSLLAVLTIGLGIGANTAIFSVVNGVLLKPLPYQAPEQLVRLFERSEQQPKFPMSPGNFQDYRDRNTSLAGLALYTRRDLELSDQAHPERWVSMQITAGYFDLLGIKPMLGREFTRQDELPDNTQIVILSHGLWRRRFNSDPKIVGQSLTLLGRPFTVVGVLPPGVQHVGGDYRSTSHGENVDAWWPVELKPQSVRFAHYLNAIGRLKPGVTAEQAGADLNTLAGQLAVQFPNSNQGWSIAVRPLHEEIVGRSRTMLWVLLGVVVFVLLIACVNIANLLLARATAREREIALRAALGAKPGRIIRQMLTESMLLALVGGVLGVLLAQWAIETLRVLGPEQLPRLQAVSINGRLLLFTFGLTLITGLLFGLAPALQARGIQLNELIKEGGKSGGGARQRRLRDALVVAEVALALVLLVGAGLLMRSFLKLQHANPGFNPDRVLTAALSLPRARYNDADKAIAFHDRLLEKISALPGVQSTGFTSDLPWTGYDENAGFTVEGKTFPPNDGPTGRYHFASADYFRTIGTPLIAGRFFNSTDRKDGPRVILINQSFADRYWPGESAVGKRITFSSRPAEKDWRTVVGVVGDVKDSPISTNAAPAFYMPMSQGFDPQMILTIRSNADPLALVETVRNEIRAIDPQLPLADVRMLDSIASTAVGGQRFTLWLVGLFALTAVVLASIGVYSVLSFLVAQRTHEIGVRMALGAGLRSVLFLTLRQGMKPVLLGVALGVAACFGLTRLMKGLLFEISATDPLTFTVIAISLIAVALVACYLPARRATNVDPMVALRYE